MKTRNSFILAAVAIAFLLMASLMFMPQADVSAAPQAAPTPAASVNLPGVASNIVTFWNGSVITDDGNSSTQNIANHAVVDLQVVLDHDTVNTATLKLQFSNDGVNWVDGATTITDSVVDANTLQQYAVFGRFARVNANVTDNTVITATVIGVAK